MKLLNWIFIFVAPSIWGAAASDATTSVLENGNGITIRVLLEKAKGLSVSPVLTGELTATAVLSHLDMERSLVEDFVTIVEEDLLDKEKVERIIEKLIGIIDSMRADEKSDGEKSVLSPNRQESDPFGREWDSSEEDSDESSTSSEESSDDESSSEDDF